MQCKELEAVLEKDPDGSLTGLAQEHLAGCPACQDLLADLSSLVATAKTIPAEAEPPKRVWISLRAQLEAEGIIREPVEAPAGSSWRQNLSQWLRPRALATAGVGIALVIGALSLVRKPASESAGAGGQSTGAQVAGAGAIRESEPAASGRARDAALLPSPSEMAATFQQMEQDVPSNMQLAGDSAVDSSLRENLRTVNEFIAECEQHLNQNPQDELAREYLYSAYQQKANLLAAMMESGRSEH